MTTVINTPGNGQNVESGAGWMVAIAILVVAVVLFFVYGLPMIRGENAPKQDGMNVNINLPSNVNIAPSKP